MTVLDLIHELDKLPPGVKCLPICKGVAEGVDLPITRGLVYPELKDHATMVDRPERFVLE